MKSDLCSMVYGDISDISGIIYVMLVYKDSEGHINNGYISWHIAVGCMIITRFR